MNPTSFPRPTQQEREVEIRDAIEFEIGKQKMSDFELWAFHKSPVTYNENIPFLFQASRSTKFEMSDNPLEAIAQIIHLWQHRSDWKHGGT